MVTITNGGDRLRQYALVAEALAGLRKRTHKAAARRDSAQ